MAKRIIRVLQRHNLSLEITLLLRAVGFNGAATRSSTIQLLVERTVSTSNKCSCCRQRKKILDHLPLE